MKLYRRILAYYRPYLGRIFFSLLLMLGTIGFNLLKPWPVKWMIDVVLPQARQSVVAWHGFGFSLSEAVLGGCLVLIGVHVLGGALNLWNNAWLIEIGLRALLRLRTQLYSYLQHLPLHFHDKRRSGDSTFRVAYDAQAVQTFFNRGFATVVQSLGTLAFTFAVMLHMDASLALIALAVMPPLWAVIAYFAGRVRRETSTAQQEESDVLARASEGLGSIRIVHAFGREEAEVRAFEQEARGSLWAGLQLSKTQALSTLAVGAVMACGSALILYIGTQHVIEGRLLVGDLFVFLSYLAMLYQPLEQLSYTAWAMEGAAVGMERVFEILDAEDSVPDAPKAATLGRATGHIRLENVHFSYEPGSPVLQGVSLDLQPGQTVAFVGGTGAGKTTLLSLLPRFYDPTQGRILIDGHDLRSLTKKSLREQIGIVLQDTVLLSATVRENIAYGKPGASRAAIEAAARAAQAHDFISKLPQGYDTPVGERGVRLSGGQKQRIGMARAFLKAAPILLLDEPTSALDSDTEAEIMDALQNLMRRQTTVIVTHRLSTIHNVDRIDVLEEGRIVESGTGPELLARDGVYARLWRAGQR